MRGAEDRGEGFDDTIQLALLMEKGDMRQGSHVASEAEKNKESNSTPEHPEGKQPSDTLTVV